LHAFSVIEVIVKKIAFVAAVFAAALSSVLSPSFAEAKPRTIYKTYTIAGNTAGEVLVSMIRRGPTVGGVKAYATTLADFSQRGEMVSNAKSCRVRSYQFIGKFTITTPRLQNERALQGSSRAAWETFSRFLKRHEETHRALWLQCGAAHEAQALKLTGPNCRVVEAKARKLWEKTRNACRRKHEAFDAAEQRALLRQPLVRQAIATNAVAPKRRVRR
jgi:predicted secreted Zn-dependent protease